MRVRVRLVTGPRIAKVTGKNRHVASAVAALLWPGVLTTYCLALWAIASQLRLTSEFAISKGAFSHWQVWGVVAIGLNLSALTLGRYGRTGDLRFPINLMAWISGSHSRGA